jgi:toxin CptA
VSYPVGRSFILRLVLSAWTVLAVVLQIGLCPAWGLPVRLAITPWVWTCVVWGVLLAWAWRSWHVAPLGWLVWGPEVETSMSPSGRMQRVGSGWWWSEADGELGEAIARLEVAMVFNGWALLQIRWLRAGQRAIWLWVEARTVPSRWLALRRALLSHAH